MVAIIILNYNNPSDTINCIDSVEKHNSYPCKFIIVDNGSEAKNIELLDCELKQKYSQKYKKYQSLNPQANAPYISLILTNKNLGYAQGNNYALKFIEEDMNIDKILILNNDILFIEDIIPDMVNFLNRNHDEVGIISPLLLKKDKVTIDYNCARKNATNKQMLWLYASHQKDCFNLNKKYKQQQYYLLNHPELLYQKSFEIELPSGSCMLIDKDLFKSINYFDPNTFLYFEENILFKRIKKTGKKNFMLPHLKCIHLGAQTSKKVKRNYFHDIHSIRSGYYYTMTYGGINIIEKILLSIFYYSYRTRLYIRKLTIKEY